MAPSIGAVIRQAREAHAMSGVDAARAAGISPAYLSKLENDAVRKPSPHVLHRLSEVLAISYPDLMHLFGYHVPGEPRPDPADAVTSALFGGLTDDERDELLEYLAWYRARKRSRVTTRAT